MGANSKIQWTDHTFNPWIGCTKVSAGCTHCYAESLAKRTGMAVWGDREERHITSDDYWDQPLKWARDAKKAGVRRRVFCASLADVLEDRADLDGVRYRLWSLIRLTANWLDWLILTKRIENAASMIPADILDLIWLGTTVENQAAADARIPPLLQTPASVRFVSVEPLLGPVDFEDGRGFLGGHTNSECNGTEEYCSCESRPALNWVIVGGESGPGARPCNVTWIRSIIEQCKAAGVACFVKQLGAVPIQDEDDWRARPSVRVLNAANRKRVPEGTVPLKYAGKGDNTDEWPLDLCVREMPEVSR